MKLDLYLQYVENGDLSIESLSVLCLLNYCELKNQHLNLYLCISTTLDECNVESIKEKYKEYLEIITAADESPRYRDTKLTIHIKKLIELNDVISSVSLPSLRILDSSNCSLILYSGLATLYRAIVSFTAKIGNDRRLGLLGFKQNCLKACKEVSTWTNLCEYKSIEIYKKAVRSRFENRNELKSEFLDVVESILQKPLCLANRKHFKETGLKYLEDVNVNISDLLIYFTLNLILNHVDLFKSSQYERIRVWYKETMRKDEHLARFDPILACYKRGLIEKVADLALENIQSDLQIDLHELSINRKDSDESIEALKVFIRDEFSLAVPLELNRFYTEQDIRLDWEAIDKELNPKAGHLPEKRIERKCQQLENFLFLIKSLVSSKEKDTTLKIVDFCSGGGHLGILVAFFYPMHKVVLVDNKEESLQNAVKRINELNLTNIVIYKANLSNFIGQFDLGIAVHACGSSTDMIINQCIRSKASLIISPCCYGAIKSNENIEYPLCATYQQAMKSLNVRHSVLTAYSDRTEKDIKYEAMAIQCMELVDTDRILYLKQNGYSTAYLTRLLPENCTLKNNVIVASVYG